MFPKKEIWDRWCKETEGMNPVDFCAWAEKILKPNDMYHDRSSDLDNRVTKAVNEGPKILKALEDVNGALKSLHDIDEKELSSIDFCVPRRENKTARLYYLPENWEFTKEFHETLNGLNKSVLDAYITFLEAEREALIKRWNDMAKDLKPEKK